MAEINPEDLKRLIVDAVRSNAPQVLAESTKLAGKMYWLSTLQRRTRTLPSCGF